MNENKTYDLYKNELDIPKEIKYKTFLTQFEKVLYYLRESESDDLKKSEKEIKEKYRLLKEPVEKALKLRQHLNFLEKQGFKFTKQSTSEESQVVS